jgi:pilus assembly protein CpaB
VAASAPAGQAPAHVRPAVRRPLFLIGLALAFVAFLLVIVLASSIASRSSAGTAQIAVVIAVRDIHHRTAITAADLGVAHLPATSVPPAALLKWEDAVGKVAQIDVLKGQTIVTNMIAASGSGSPRFLPIPQGWDAVTIPSTELQAVGGYVAPNDVIDVQATLSETTLAPATTLPRQITKTVFPGVWVIELGTPGTKSAAGVASSLTVLLTPCDAPYLTWLLANGTVRYSLRSSTDYGPAPTGPSSSCDAAAAPVAIGPAEVDKKFGFTKA